MMSGTDYVVEGGIIGVAPTVGSYPYRALNGEQPNAE
jgi:hypothetical protein